MTAKYALDKMLKYSEDVCRSLMEETGDRVYLIMFYSKMDGAVKMLQSVDLITDEEAKKTLDEATEFMKRW